MKNPFSQNEKAILHGVIAKQICFLQDSKKNAKSIENFKFFDSEIEKLEIILDKIFEL